MTDTRDVYLWSEAVVFGGDRSAALRELELTEPGAGDLVVETEVSGVSMGTEKLFWTGEMPPFPGLGYPLVPGYETVGEVVWAGDRAAGSASDWIGRRVFVPGARCFKDAHGLFGGASSRIIVPSERVYDVENIKPEDAVLLSLAATAYHAIIAGEAPDLIVGFGVLGRLLLRITRALGHPDPTVWEINPARAEAEGVSALTAETDPRKDYRSIYDVSGAAGLIDTLVGSLGKGGTVVLAGFYPGTIQFGFAPAFMKEARLRIAAEYQPADAHALMALMREGKLSLDGLISHTAPAADAADAYSTAFTDPSCLKMMLDWRPTSG